MGHTSGTERGPDGVNQPDEANQPDDPNRPGGPDHRADTNPPDATNPPTDVLRSVSDAIGRRLAGRWWIADAAVYVIALLGAWWLHFSQDDAFISYRFARNLAQGRGLVFNPGEPVEGYTNFAWTLVHAVPEYMGWSSPMFSMFLGMAVMVGVIAVTHRLALHLFDRRRGLAFMAIAALVANATFLGYGTSGLETELQALLVTAAALIVLGATRGRDDRRVGREIAAGAIAGVALLVRLDSTVLLATVFVAHLWQVWRQPATTDPALSRAPVAFDDAPRDKAGLGAVAASALRIGVPMLVIVVPWLGWKLSYYGSILPNTLAAKSAGNPIVPIVFGVGFVLLFFFSYGAFMLIPRWRRDRREFFALPRAGQIFVVVPVWLVYICVVGGDFMEFRFFVPILPLLAILAGYLVDRYTVMWKQIAVVAVMLLFSLGHATYKGIPIVLTLRDLSHWPGHGSKTNWQAMGETLGRAFPGGLEATGQPLIAVAPLGIIPYYSDLPTIDMLGLNDTYVARHGEQFATYVPGHVRLAPLRYLEERDVNLIIGEPLTVDSHPRRDSYRASELIALYPVVDLKQLPDTAKVIEIPLTPELNWLVIYLTPNEKVDAAIQANDWRVVPIERVCDHDDENILTKAAGTATC